MSADAGALGTPDCKVQLAAKGERWGVGDPSEAAPLLFVQTVACSGGVMVVCGRWKGRLKRFPRQPESKVGGAEFEEDVFRIVLVYVRI